MSLFRNVISKLGTQVQQTAETVGQTVGQTVGKRVSQSLSNSLDAALSSKLGHAVGEAWQKTIAGVAPGLSDSLPPWTARDFEKQLRNRLKPHVGQHPFYKQLREGSLNQTQLHVWLANEWYFQQNLPLKDAAILSNCEDAQFRRVWTRRLLEQDGGESGAGAVEHWARLSTSLGVDSDTLQEMTLVTPGVRFAMDTYINFARRAPWTEAVCASLGELANGENLRALFDTLAQHYGKPDAQAVEFFTQRASHQRKDWDAALGAMCDYFKSREDQEYALDILQFKHDILWTCLDSVSLSPVSTGSLQASGASDGDMPTVKGESPQRTRKKKQTGASPGKKSGKAGAKGTERASSASAEKAASKAAGHAASQATDSSAEETSGTAAEKGVGKSANKKPADPAEGQ